MRRIEKPKEAEYAPYAIRYIGLLPDDRLVLEHLQKNLEAHTSFITLAAQRQTVVPIRGG